MDQAKGKAMKSRLSARMDWSDGDFPVVLEATRGDSKAQVRLSIPEARQLSQELGQVAGLVDSPVKRLSPGHWRVGPFEVQRFPNGVRVVMVGTWEPLQTFSGPDALLQAFRWATEGERGA